MYSVDSKRLSRLKLVKLLLGRGCDINVQNVVCYYCNYTLTHWHQCLNKNVSSNVSLYVQIGRTALMTAVQCDHEYAIRLLMERGAALHVKDKVCHSPIIPILFYEFYFLNRMVRLL